MNMCKETCMATETKKVLIQVAILPLVILFSDDSIICETLTMFDHSSVITYSSVYLPTLKAVRAFKVS